MTANPKFWDKIARKYAATPVRDTAAYARTLGRTRTYLTTETRVLEIGCGTGTTALTLAPDVAHYTASDFSAEMLAIAREKAAEGGRSNLSFVQAAADDVSLDRTGDGGTVDVVLAFSLLHLVPDLPAVVGRVFSQLPPGGHFISKTVCLGDGSLVYRVALPLMRLVGYAPPVAFLKGDALAETLREAGFEIIENEDHNRSPNCRFVVARKPAA